MAVDLTKDSIFFLSKGQRGNYEGPLVFVFQEFLEKKDIPCWTSNEIRSERFRREGREALGSNGGRAECKEA